MLSKCCGAEVRDGEVKRKYEFGWLDFHVNICTKCSKHCEVKEADDG